MTTLSYYFDFISPYTYLGWPRVRALAERTGARLRPVPVLFAAFLDAHGHKGPAEIEPKRIYVLKNVLRLAHELGVPLRPPPAHPFNPLLALRLASLPGSQEQQARVIELLFRRTWGEGVGVTDAAAVAEALEGIGLPGAAMVRDAGTDASKQRVREQTQEALARGVFGVPTMVVEETGELFWGQDAIPHVERYLAGEDPVPEDLLEQWAELPAGAVRPAMRGR